MAKKALTPKEAVKKVRELSKGPHLDAVATGDYMVVMRMPNVKSTAGGIELPDQMKTEGDVADRCLVVSVGDKVTVASPGDVVAVLCDNGSRIKLNEGEQEIDGDTVKDYERSFHVVHQEYVFAQLKF